MTKMAVLLPFMDSVQAGTLCQVANFTEVTERDFHRTWHLAGGQMAPAWLPTSNAIEALPPAAIKLAEAARDARTWSHYSDDDLQFVLVKTADLVTLQYRINWDAVEAMAAAAPAPGDLEGLFRFCFPQGTLGQPVSHDNAVLFASLSPGAFVVQLPAEVRRVNASELEVVVAVSARPNYLQVAVLQDRLLVVNGTHRVAALLLRGHEYIPCLLQAEVLDAGLLGFNPPMTFAPERTLADRPPLVADFLRPELAQRFACQDVMEMFQVLFHVEDVPLPMPDVR